MKSMLISEFKARCLAELKTVQESGEEIEVTLRGKPIARVVPARNGGRILGQQAGSMVVHGDLIKSDLEDDFLAR